MSIGKVDSSSKPQINLICCLLIACRGSLQHFITSSCDWSLEQIDSSRFEHGIDHGYSANMGGYTRTKLVRRPKWQ